MRSIENISYFESLRKLGLNQDNIELLNYGSGFIPTKKFNDINFISECFDNIKKLEKYYGKYLHGKDNLW